MIVEKLAFQIRESLEREWEVNLGVLNYKIVPISDVDEVSQALFSLFRVRGIVIPIPEIKRFLKRARPLFEQEKEQTDLILEMVAEDFRKQIPSSIFKEEKRKKELARIAGLKGLWSLTKWLKFLRPYFLISHQQQIYLAERCADLKWGCIFADFERSLTKRGLPPVIFVNDYVSEAYLYYMLSHELTHLIQILKREIYNDFTAEIVSGIEMLKRFPKEMVKNLFGNRCQSIKACFEFESKKIKELNSLAAQQYFSRAICHDWQYILGDWLINYTIETNNKASVIQSRLKKIHNELRKRGDLWKEATYGFLLGEQFFPEKWSAILYLETPKTPYPREIGEMKGSEDYLTYLKVLSPVLEKAMKV